MEKEIGDPGMWKTLQSYSDDERGFLKTTSAIQVSTGCVLRIYTNYDKVSESLVFVPGASIVDDINGGRKLV